MQDWSGPPLYGFDIETDTTVDGLDPSCSPITAVAVSDAEGDRVFAGAEPELLRAVQTHLDALEPGVLVTWNGSGFDLPFLADRARRVGLDRAGFTLRIVLDRSLPPRRTPLPGHEGIYRARWGGHRHLDLYRVFRSDVGNWFGLSCALKSIARLTGVEAVVEDRSELHTLDAERLATYVASDARATRALALRRGPNVLAHVDA